LTMLTTCLGCLLQGKKHFKYSASGIILHINESIEKTCFHDIG
jgi:hypothetical protein